MAVQLIPGGLLFAGSLILRESPFHLFRKGNDKQAMANLVFLRNLPEDHPYIIEEVMMAREKLQEELDMADGKTGIKGYLSGACKQLFTVKDMRHRMLVAAAELADVPGLLRSQCSPRKIGPVQPASVSRLKSLN